MGYETVGRVRGSWRAWLFALRVRHPSWLFSCRRRFENSRLRIISGLAAIFDGFDPIFSVASRINPAVETIFFPAPMIFDATVLIFFVPKNFIFHTTKIISGAPSIMSGSMKIVFISEKIICATEKIFSETEKIFLDNLLSSRNQRVADLSL